MFSCTLNETKLIQEGKALSVTRPCPAGHPYTVGGKLLFTSEFVAHTGKETPFAVGTIISVRPITVGEMRRDKRLCQMDGFSGPPEWYGHLRQRYKTLRDEDKLVRLQFKLEEMDKDVANRAVPEPQERQNTDRVQID
ncbi:MAG: hypothetical protein WC406_08420 [Methanoregula sp.]|jgi:hypothetical protein